MSFKDKVVIVTGASSGIGAAIAVAFSAEGANVVMVGRNENKLAAVAARCNNPLVVKADVANDDDAKNIIDKTIEHYGKIDVLVNNAAVVSWVNLTSTGFVDTYDRIMGINLRAVIFLTSLSTPFLIKSKGNVINISSISALIPTAGFSIYSASKAAVNHFGVCAASELAPYGVRVNTINPGPVETDILKNSNSSSTWGDFKKVTALYSRLTPYWVSKPEEIADLVMFIASDKAKAITGSNQVSDNGVFVKRS